MTKRQVAELLKFLQDVYPNLEITQSRINTWTHLLKRQNPAKVMKRAEQYVLENKFPPTVADLSERITEAHNDDFLTIVRKWESEAVDKPQSRGTTNRLHRQRH